jgi:DNA mismatch endonuclease (patch repair protein)
MPKSPSYTGLSPASPATSRAKRSNRHRDTTPERLLRRELWRLSLRYRANVAALPGKPDIVFPTARVVVFCDGDFWHGRNWDVLQGKLEKGTNPGYWTAKIARNIERDAEHGANLRQAGWCVLRLWETEIKRDTTLAARQVLDVVQSRNARYKSDRTPARDVG